MLGRADCSRTRWEIAYLGKAAHKPAGVLAPSAQGAVSTHVLNDCYYLNAFSPLSFLLR